MTVPLPEPFGCELYCGHDLYSYTRGSVHDALGHINLYTADQMHAHAAAVSAADNAVLRERIKVLKAAIQHYEAALKLSWPEGAKGGAFDCWNYARTALKAGDAGNV